MYYEVSVKLTSVDEKGRQKSKSEKLLINAVSVTDAEVKTHKDFEGTTLDYSISSVKESRIVQVIN